MMKTLIPTEIQQPIDNSNTTQYFDYTMIADRLRTVSRSNNGHATGVFKPVYGYPPFPLTTKAVQSKEHIFENL